METGQATGFKLRFIAITLTIALLILGLALAIYAALLTWAGRLAVHLGQPAWVGWATGLAVTVAVLLVRRYLRRAGGVVLAERAD
jgi:hypothetical protein